MIIIKLKVGIKRSSGPKMSNIFSQKSQDQLILRNMLLILRTICLIFQIETKDKDEKQRYYYSK